MQKEHRHGSETPHLALDRFDSCRRVTKEHKQRHARRKTRKKTISNAVHAAELSNGGCIPNLAQTTDRIKRMETPAE